MDSANAGWAKEAATDFFGNRGAVIGLLAGVGGVAIIAIGAAVLLHNRRTPYAGAHPNGDINRNPEAGLSSAAPATTYQAPQMTVPTEMAQTTVTTDAHSKPGMTGSQNNSTLRPLSREGLFKRISIDMPYWLSKDRG